MEREYARDTSFLNTNRRRDIRHSYKYSLERKTAYRIENGDQNSIASVKMHQKCKTFVTSRMYFSPADTEKYPLP